MSKNIWFTADTHFGSNGIIRMDNRPFANFEEMDEALLDNWNSVVKNRDEVYLLGDFFHHSQRHNMESTLNALNGKIHLVVGNHDDDLVRMLKNHRLGLAERKIVSINEIVFLNDDRRRFMMCHYPIVCYPGRFSKNGDRSERIFMLHGHVHTTGEADMVLRLQEEQEVPMNLLNVGTMLWNYTPVALEETVAAIKKRQQ